MSVRVTDDQPDNSDVSDGEHDHQPQDASASYHETSQGDALGASTADAGVGTYDGGEEAAQPFDAGDQSGIDAHGASGDATGAGNDEGDDATAAGAAGSGYFGDEGDEGDGSFAAEASGAYGETDGDGEHKHDASVGAEDATADASAQADAEHDSALADHHDQDHEQQQQQYHDASTATDQHDHEDGHEHSADAAADDHHHHQRRAEDGEGTDAADASFAGAESDRQQHADEKSGRGGSSDRDGAGAAETEEADAAAAGGGGGGGATDDDDRVVCEIMILPDRFTHTDTFPATLSLAALKASIARSFKTKPNFISMTMGASQQEVPQQVLLGTLVQRARAEAAAASSASSSAQQQQQLIGTQAQPLQLQMRIRYTDQDAAGAGVGGASAAAASSSSSSSSSSSGEEKKGGSSSSRSMGGGFATSHLPDVTQVNLGPSDKNDPTSPPVLVLVKIVRENLRHKKPFLGGYRNKKSGVVSHHAATQTVRRKRGTGVTKFHRETQTVQTCTRSQQSMREAGVQMDRPDLLTDPSNDRFIVPQPYLTAAQVERLRHEKAREIECFLRMCFAWRRVRRLREAKLKMEEAEQLAKKKEAEEKEADTRRQTERRMHPRTKEDFDTLHRELEAWRLHETQRIANSGLPEDQHKFQLEEVLGKEVVVLQIIGRLKIAAAKENSVMKTKEVLEKMSSPKEWRCMDGEPIEVETPFTIRAKQLVTLYDGLCLPNLTTTQRVDVLLHTKYAVKEFDCALSREIVELIAREEDLLRRGRSPESLAGLRKRIAQLFLQFVQTPEFNPEAANYLTVPQAFSPLENLNKAATNELKKMKTGVGGGGGGGRTMALQRRAPAPPSASAGANSSASSSAAAAAAAASR